MASSSADFRYISATIDDKSICSVDKSSKKQENDSYFYWQYGEQSHIDVG